MLAELLKKSSVFVFESLEAARTRLSSHIANVSSRLQVLVLPIDRIDAKMLHCPTHCISADATEFVVFTYLNNHARFIGYVRQTSFSKLDFITTTTSSSSSTSSSSPAPAPVPNVMLLPAAFCSLKHTPLYLTCGPHPTNNFVPHTSFCNYKKPMQTDTEFSMDQVGQCIDQRMQMFMRGPQQLPLQPLLNDEDSVLLDNFAYFFILVCVTDRVFRSTYHTLSASDVLDKWVACEEAISKHRMAMVPLSVLVTRFLPPYARLVDKPDFISNELRYGLRCVQQPFEFVPPYLLSHRQAVLVKGNAFVPATEVAKICTLFHASVHRLHANNATVSFSQQQPPYNLARFASAVRSRFAALCGATITVSSSSSPSALMMGSFKPSLPQLMSHSAPCMRILLARSVIGRTAVPAVVVSSSSSSSGSGDNKHLKYPERMQLARYLYALNWNKDDVMRVWRPKFTLAYSQRSDAANAMRGVENELKFSYNNMLKRKAQGKPVGATCFGMCEENLCPLRAGDLRSTKQLCMKNSASAIQRHTTLATFSPHSFVQ